jgi:hypothetical protein
VLGEVGLGMSISLRDIVVYFEALQLPTHSSRARVIHATNLGQNLIVPACIDCKKLQSFFDLLDDPICRNKPQNSLDLTH